MTLVQTNSLSLTEVRLLEGKKGLAYWCMSAILHSLFLFFLFSFCFILFYFDSFPTLTLSFLALALVVIW